MKLNVTISSPVIQIPRSSCSKDMFIVELGTLKLSNEHNALSIQGVDVSMEKMNLAITSMHIKTKMERSHDSFANTYLLRHVTTSIKIDRLLDLQHNDKVPQMKVIKFRYNKLISRSDKHWNVADGFSIIGKATILGVRLVE